MEGRLIFTAAVLRGDLLVFAPLQPQWEADGGSVAGSLIEGAPVSHVGVIRDVVVPQESQPRCSADWTSF